MRYVLTILLLASACLAQSDATWLPPIGVPTPSWGVVNGDAPARPSPWVSETPCSYYVDPGAGCSDSRTYGTPLAARCSIPTALRTDTGACANQTILVEVHTDKGVNLTSDYLGGAKCSASYPCYIRGLSSSNVPRVRGSSDGPIVSGGFLVYGSYLLVENLWLNHTGLPYARKWGFAQSGTGTPNCATEFRKECADHVTFRHIETQGTTDAAHFNVCGTWNLGGYQTALPAGSSFTDIVWWDVYTHDEGQMSPLTDADQASCSAFGIGKYVQRAWLLDSEIYNVAQSCVQLVSGNSGAANDGTEARWVSIGDNIGHRCSKTGFGVKHGADIIFSGNKSYDIIEKTYSASKGFIAQYGPSRVWFINNESWNNTYGVDFGSEAGVNSDLRYFVIGNRFHDITEGGIYHPTWNPASTYSSGGVVVTSLNPGATLYIANNVFDHFNQANGINISQVSSPGLTTEIADNIFSRPQQATAKDILFGSGANWTTGTIDYNLWDAQPKVYNVTTGYTTMAALQGASRCANCPTPADPKFVNAASGNYAILSDSPAKDVGSASTVYDTFASLYGISIAYDFNGISRPQGSAWDIGASEYSADAPPTYTLTVSKDGTGAGTVSGSGIECGATCTAEFYSGNNATLTATPAVGSTFAGWTGAGTGTGTRTVAMAADRAVTATFNVHALASITVSPATASIHPGDTQTYTYTCTYDDASTDSLCSPTWTSSDETIARAGAQLGTATGVGRGPVTITATSGAVSGTAKLYVWAPVVNLGMGFSIVQ